jgi:hypothetical protein
LKDSAYLMSSQKSNKKLLKNSEKPFYCLENDEEKNTLFHFPHFSNFQLIGKIFFEMNFFYSKKSWGNK